MTNEYYEEVEEDRREEEEEEPLAVQDVTTKAYASATEAPSYEEEVAYWRDN
jgi:hypothetical protein